MIRITCCRLGKLFPNSGMKGTFVKEFDNMQQLTFFIRHSSKSLFFPYIKCELTKKQYQELRWKLNSLICNKK